MRTRLLTPLLWLLLTLFCAADHPMHLAAHELTVGAKRTDWALRIFTDDLEDAISASLGGTKVRLERPEGRSQAENYVRSKLTVFRGRKALDLHIDGFTYQPDAVEIRMHVDGGLPLSITDRLLHDRFDDQRNVYFVRGPKGRIDAVSTKENPRIELK
ncbi:MAG: hypothetical protein NWQ40_01080 [Schleiferiaceae bacterium]|nr:hypothetical protein [Schleiferiaceae bacterium]